MRTASGLAYAGEACRTVLAFLIVPAAASVALDAQLTALGAPVLLPFVASFAYLLAVLFGAPAYLFLRLAARPTLVRPVGRAGSRTSVGDLSDAGALA